ncbi:4-fold beta flower protein [Pseudoxanthomonas mexicana]|uniref:4-fold beta flower protein n=1 Tax=Pseudoxanthomonas mexicana TaxID=128785 RepID=UPI00289AE3AC|nr:hypothetical protein [Pseudoxanthomonas mexicana]
MKVLISKPFNESMQRLNGGEQAEVASIFNVVSNMPREVLMASPLLIKLESEDQLYTLRTAMTRIFCAFTEDALVFVDVKTARERHLGEGLSTGPAKGGETTLFGPLGDPQAYIAPDAIYSFDGRPLGYLEGINIYGFNGAHLGWFESGIVRDHRGHRVGFTKSAIRGLTQFEPFKGFKQFKPFKAFKQLAPFKPFYSNINSEQSLLQFLEQGRK